MPEYHVAWKIEVDAPNAIAAAQQAYDIQANPEGTATIFEVRPFPIDPFTEAVLVDVATGEEFA